jgi:hypothetical protein
LFWFCDKIGTKSRKFQKNKGKFKKPRKNSINPEILEKSKNLQNLENLENSKTRELQKKNQKIDNIPKI